MWVYNSLFLYASSSLFFRLPHYVKNCPTHEIVSLVHVHGATEVTGKQDLMALKHKNGLAEQTVTKRKQDELFCGKYQKHKDA